MTEALKLHYMIWKKYFKVLVSANKKAANNAACKTK